MTFLLSLEAGLSCISTSRLVVTSLIGTYPWCRGFHGPKTTDAGG